MDKQTVIDQEATYLLQTYLQPEIVFSHGEGVWLYDTEGHQYLDFTSGIAVTALGHAHPAWVTAVSQQAAKLTHISNLYHSAPHVALAEKLVTHSFADRVYFCNSGAEANEAAIKFARKVGKARQKEQVRAKTKVIAFTHGFHGRTIGALATTYKEKYRTPFEPLMPDVHFLPFNDIAAAESAINDQTCAVIVEPIQGEGGINPATIEFLQTLRQQCDIYKALLIFDEVQCGLGRSGHLWAHEPFGVTPDIMTLAKPLAGGLPIGAALLTQTVADHIKPGDHGSTFAGGPLVCAAANAVFDTVNQADFLTKVQENGAYLQHRLRTLETDQIESVRGAGLMVGVQLKTAVSPLVTRAQANGLLVLSAGENVLRLLPPLIVERDHIDQAVDILATCLDT